MPKITNTKVIEILRKPYFDQHVAMHLARERLTLPDGTKLPLILPPCMCDDCGDKGKKAGAAMPGMADTTIQDGKVAGMIEAGQPGSGKQLLEMHHKMIRVFRFLVENLDPPMKFLCEWSAGPNGQYQWKRPGDPDDSSYAPQLWDLDYPDNLPHEIVGMFKVTDPEYLGLVFAGVKRLVETKVGKVDDAVDKLGRFIERGVKTGQPDGSGFHDTMHEYLAAREGRAAQGAEMNKLTKSRFNDYFWNLHFWIDAQYGRLLEERKEKFETSGLDPTKLMMCMDPHKARKMPGMTMTS
jgi:hypothetical protein